MFTVEYSPKSLPHSCAGKINPANTMAMKTVAALLLYTKRPLCVGGVIVRSPYSCSLQAPGYSCREQRIFLSQVLAHICLSKRNNARRVKFSCLRRRSCTHTKALEPQLALPTAFPKLQTHKRRIIHAQYHHTLMFRTILAPPSNMRLQHVSPIQERHLAVRLDPHLISRVRCDYGERGDV